jgi:serine/threonine protein kinase
MNQKTYSNALPADYELHWYKVEQVLGQGAFGITYLAHDVNLERQVAIKEYMPGQLSIRNNDLTVQAISSEQKDDFEWGLKRFISEARTLTKFEHPNLVRVFNVFEMNHSAYMVMNYEIGKGLQDILKSRGTLREDELIKILVPLMGGLEVMHEKGFIHRDIKPGNIFIRQDGSPVLLDFGSARQTRNPRDGGRNVEPQTLTNFVSPGYAPIEQYTGKSDRQGPWTDIYGMGATLYRAITGQMPIASIDRSETIVHDGKDAYIPVSGISGGNYSEKFLVAIDHALAFKTGDRPQSIAEWQVELGITQDDIETVPIPDVHTETTDDVATQKLNQSEEVTIDLTGGVVEKTEKVEEEVKTFTTSSQVTPLSSSGQRKLLITGAVVASLIIIILFFSLREDVEEAPITEKPEPVAHIQQQEQTEETLVVTEEVIQEESVSGTTADSIDQQRIQELLISAEDDIKALRLTNPKNNNAFEKYQQVLKLDENNEAAKQGVLLIADKYVSLAYGAMESNKLDRAAAYLRKAERISPGSERIATAQTSLQVKTKAAASDVTPEVEQQASSNEETEDSEEGMWGDMKKWYETQAEKNKAVQKNNTASDDVIRSLGGQ